MSGEARSGAGGPAARTAEALPTAAERRRIAVVGSGIAGLTAAYVLQRTADVTLYEADSASAATPTRTTSSTLPARLGPDARRRQRLHRPQRRHLSDAAAAVRRTRRADAGGRDEHVGLLRRLRARVRRCAWDAAASSPSRDRSPVAALPANAHRGAALSPGGARASWPPASSTATATATRRWPTSWRAGSYSPYFVRHFMTPLVAAVWSCSPADGRPLPGALPVHVPGRTTGCFRVSGSPTWRTVVGGSRTYVDGWPRSCPRS